ncbi:MAG: putative rane protein [Candidatus Angelobacter sp.]|nr:putative rane protein [Candidatus Angelobacter sp.]
MTVSLWKLGGLTPLQLVKRIWKQMDEDDVAIRSAALSYYFLLALFPLLLFLVTLLGFLAGPGSQLRNTLLTDLGRLMPGSASELVSKTLSQVSSAASGSKLIFGLLAALWAASSGMSAIVSTLNVAYRVRETRSWLKSRFVVAVGLTISLSLFVLAALTLVLFGGQIGEAVAIKMGLGAAFTLAWKLVQWPLIIFFMLLAFAMVYYFAPNLEDPAWYWISPGAVVGLFLWIVGSLGFRVYLHYFNSYNATYGSLGAVIILMLWFYLTGAAIIIGAEVNSQIGHATEEKKQREDRARTLQWRHPAAA